MTKIINKFWLHLAAFIASKPRLVDFIISTGHRNPYMHLQHSDGSDYMGRWWLMPKWLLTPDEKGDPYPKKWCPFLIRLHHIRSEDWDRDIHDHPADYRTILLRGYYLELDIYGHLNLRQQGETKAARAETWHRITEISPGGVWTIFIMKPKRNEWGFLVNGRKVPWREYFGINTNV